MEMETCIKLMSDLNLVYNTTEKLLTSIWSLIKTRYQMIYNLWLPFPFSSPIISNLTSSLSEGEETEERWRWGGSPAPENPPRRRKVRIRYLSSQVFRIVTIGLGFLFRPVSNWFPWNRWNRDFLWSFVLVSYGYFGFGRFAPDSSGKVGSFRTELFNLMMCSFSRKKS